MGSWFGRRRAYDRKRSLSQASRARARGRNRAAIEHYREVLAHEPFDPDVHRRLAPLLVAARQGDEAWRSYRLAARSLAGKGFLEHAAGVLREAAGGLRRREVWEELARVELERDRPADAHHSLLEGRRAMRGRARRGDAIQLLLAARRLDRHHFEANFDLAGLLARSGARPLAERVLTELAIHRRGPQLRRVRARLLRLRPSPTRLWHWLQAWNPHGAGPGRASRPTTPATRSA